MYNGNKNIESGIDRLRTFFLSETQENYAAEKGTILKKFVIIDSTEE